MINIIGNYIGKISSAFGGVVASIFRTRVVADGGIVEADTCLADTVDDLNSRGFYNQASFLLTPNGYKADKLYSLLPDDGSGDFAFVRASTTTRQGPSLVEDVPWNLITRSSELNLAPWSVTGVGSGGITADQTTSPIGTTTADRFNTTGIRTVFQALTLSGGQTYTFSVYAKVVSDGVKNAFRLFNNNSPTLFTDDLIATTSWQRFTFTFVAGGTNVNLGITRPSTDAACDIYFWGAQLVLGSEPKEFLNLSSDSFDIPRVDYSSSVCPVLSLEPQRTNLLLHSGAFQTASWALNAATISADAIIGPNGRLNAEKLQEDNTSTAHYTTQTVSKAASSLTYALSCYMKAGERTWGRLQASGSVAARAWFDLQNGVVGTQSVTGPAFSILDARMVDVGDGWWRCSIVFSTDTNTSVLALILAQTQDNETTYQGVTGNGIYIWGAQLELGNYLSSHIPTTTATVTRIVDAVTAVTGVTDLIGQTEGTLYFEGSSFADSTAKRIALSDGTTNNRILLDFNSTNEIRYFVQRSGSTQSSIITAFTSHTNYKIACVYRTNYAALFINGVKIGEDTTSVAMPVSLTRIGIDEGDGTLRWFGRLKALAVSKTCISDAEALALTA